MVELLNSMILAIEQDDKENLQNLFDSYFESKKYYLQFSKLKNVIIPLQPFLFDVSVSLNSMKCQEFIQKYPIERKKKRQEYDSENENEDELSEIENNYDECESVINEDYEIGSEDEYQKDLTKKLLKKDVIINADINKFSMEFITRTLNQVDCETNNNFSSLTSWIISPIFNKNEYPETTYECFYIAANENRLNIVEYLLAHKIDATRISKHGTIVYNGAVYKENYDLISLLHQYEVEQTADKFGRTPLHIAAKNKNDAMVDCLLELGADATQMDWRGWTPIHVAAKYGCSEMINSFYDYEFDINQRSKSGITPLHIAAIYGKTNVCETLYQLGAEMEPIDKRGFTPMNFASHRKKKNVIQFFESIGINNTNIDPEYHKKPKHCKSKSTRNRNKTFLF